MGEIVKKTLFRSLAIVAVSFLLAIITNSVRSQSLKLVAEVPYEIYSKCLDSEVKSETLVVGDLAPLEGAVLYVDARGSAQYELKHVEGAINVPYSVLFGASEIDLKLVSRLAAERKLSSVVVYGTLSDPNSPGQTIDLSKPLAQQLTEYGVLGVKYVPGGLEVLNRSAVPIVQGAGGVR
jgi:hypothetical protein